MLKININGKIFYCEKGEKLSKILIDNGFKTENFCGGRGICKKCKVLVNGKEELSCQYEVTECVEVKTIYNDEITSETGAVISNQKHKGDNLIFCLDIGTTTLALALVNLDSKNIIDVKTATNPQRVYGADIMSRIAYCNENGVYSMKKVLIDKLNKLISDFNLNNDLDLTVSANATMLHIFFGISPESIGVSPYKAKFLDFKTEKGEILGLKGINNVTSLPSIHAFVGADIIAGLNYIGEPAKNKCNLLVDLGTNAEVVLYNNEFVASTSAAAGPCFEGANIDCGMSATNGALFSFKLFGNKRIFKTIGECEATGICGTGLIDIVSELIKNQIVDSSGAMDWEKFNITDNIFISQKDIRQFQLAKSAVCSAILALVKIKNIDFDNIENMYISGGFSAKINIDNAVFTGLIPKKLKNKCKVINNSSLLGNIKYNFEKTDLSIYLKNAEYIDLSLNPLFSDLFIENMEF